MAKSSYNIQLKFVSGFNSLAGNRNPDNLGNKTGVHGRLDYLIIEKSKLDKLIKQMKLKAPRAKLTHVLAVILCDCYKRVCLKHNATSKL